MHPEKNSDSVTVVWFRKDLRLSDNSALVSAVESGARILPVFIWAPEEAGQWSLGAASKWWLHHSLSELGAEVSRRGGELILRSGQSLSVLKSLIKETGATRVVWNRRYEEPLRKIDAEIKCELRKLGVEIESFNSCLLNEPHTVSTGEGKAYKVYTPYWRRVKDREIAEPVSFDSRKLRFVEDFPKSESLESFGLMPTIEWYRDFEPEWSPGEKGAARYLSDFLEEAVIAYDEARNLPSIEGTSRLSPHLHWGEIGPRQIMKALREKCDVSAEGPHVFSKEIYWREFAYNVLYHFPHTSDEPLRGEFRDFPWKKDLSVLRVWQKGETGYPIVDAGMRQLWQTGWMHNRVRMIVSSLLVKHLLQNWKDGANWFWDTLLDADLASNTLGWQWSGGCGADAAPYFRIFNPITQGKKFDENGEYVRKFVPELKELPDQYIHEPWEAPDYVLKNAGIQLGEDYPMPIVAHKEGRARALKAFEQFRK